MTHKFDRDAFDKKMRDAVIIDFPSLDEVIDFIKTNLEPDDVFTESALGNWAEKNDYVKYDEIDNDE